MARRSSSPSLALLVAAALLLCAFVPAFVRADSCVATLYGGDSFMSSLSFVDGLSAKVLQGGMFRNANTDISFQVSGQSGALYLAPEGSRSSAVVDLGSSDSIAARYRVNPPQGALYATIQYVDDMLALFLTQDSLQPFYPSDIAGLGSLQASTAFTPVAGSIYLVRESSSSYYPETVTKLMILDYQPGKSVTFRYDVIQGVSTGNCVFNPDQGRTLLAVGFEEPAPVVPSPPSNAPVPPPPASSSGHSTAYFVVVLVVSSCSVLALGISMATLVLVLLRTQSSYTSIN